MELGADFSQDVDGFGFEFLEVVDGVGGHGQGEPLLSSGSCKDKVRWCDRGVLEGA